MEYPPLINEDDRVILFDGMCKLCNAWCNLVITHDKDRLFQLCSVQSEEGAEILKHFGFPADYYETMVYVEGKHCFQKSDAFLKIVRKLGPPWSMLAVLRVVPPVIRDWFYERIALNRYALFGKYDYCRLPTADHDKRFLSVHGKSEQD